MIVFIQGIDLVNLFPNLRRLPGHLFKFSPSFRPTLFNFRAYSAASVSHLAPSVQKFILEKAELCQPDQIVVCDGSVEGEISFTLSYIDETFCKQKRSPFSF